MRMHERRLARDRIETLAREMGVLPGEIANVLRIPLPLLDSCGSASRHFSALPPCVMVIAKMLQRSGEFRAAGKLRFEIRLQRAQLFDVGVERR